MSGRTIVIGDVHGCLRELDRMLEELQPSEDDRLIFLGDLVNKGPDSLGVVRRVRALGAESIVGNHEARLLHFRRTGDRSGLKADDLPTIEALAPEDWTWMAQLSAWIELPAHNAIAVHGGFLPGQHWRTQPLEVVTRVQVIDAQGRPRKRSEAPAAPAWADSWSGPEFVVYGHTPREQVYRQPHSLGIDTGCVYGGHLTSLIFPERVLCQVPAARAYRP